MVLDIFTFVEGLWLILPAYAANGLAPLVKYKGSLHPIDGGRTLRGKPILGPGKTWEGLLLGVAAAVAVSAVHMAAYPYLPWHLSEELHGVALNIVPMTLLLGLLLGAGAMLGDIAGSLIKRRLGLPRGSLAPILDQDDFVVGAFAFASIAVAMELSWVILYLMLTPLFHLASNFIGYKLKVKPVPW